MRLVRPDPWQRLPEESPEEFDAFAAWLLTSPRRNPPQHLRETANERDWAKRAAEYDRFIARPKRPQDQALAAQLDLVEILCAEAAKLKRLVLSSENAVLTPKDLLSFAALVTEARGTLAALSADEVDYSSLSDEEIETLTALQLKTRKAI